MADEPGDENPEENPENAPPPEPEIPLEDPNPPVVVTLNKSVLSKSVSQVGKTFDGLSFAFTSLTAEGKELEVLGDDIKDYKYLRNLSLAKNLLKSLQEVKELPYLLSLNGSQNQIENIDFCDEEDKHGPCFVKICNTEYIFTRAALPPCVHLSLCVCGGGGRMSFC